MNQFNTKIKILRHQRNFSLQSVAGFLEIDPVQLAAIEDGKQNASKDQILSLASCFGTNENELIQYYLRDLISQEKKNNGYSQRLENLSNELLSLDSRSIQSKVHKPVKPYSLWIKQIICYEGNPENTVHIKAFPDGHVHLVINLSSDLTHGKAWVVGVQEKHSDYKIKHNDTIVAIQFTLTGFHAITGIPITEIKNRTIDAYLIFGQDIFLLREKLISCQVSDADEITKIIETYFLNKRKDIDTEAAIISFITENIDIPLDQLIHKTGYSHKHVIHLFKKNTGVTPKYYQRIKRFNNALKDILAVKSNLSWADIVFRNNFYDQPHFIKEFRHFSGFNPQSFMETGCTCSSLLHVKNTEVN
jgi:AraC-like DNA-binding protein/transcriptional regulator with XRE-family HTH domain